MVRNLLGVLLAVVGAAAAVWSVSRDWYGGRLGRSYQVGELFSSGGITGTQSGLWTGLFLPVLAAAVLTLLAVTARSRLLAALAGVLVLGFTFLWMIRQGQYAGTLTAGAGGLGEGVGYAIGGGVLLLMAAVAMRGRSRHGRRRKGRGRVDDSQAAVGHGAAEEADEEWEHSEMPQPYGPFGTTNGPHGAYMADTGAPNGRSHDPYYDDDSTPAEEWDPWGTAPARGAPWGGESASANGHPADSRPAEDRPAEGWTAGDWTADWPADERPSNDWPADERPSDGWPADRPSAEDRPPQGPQRQQPPPGTG